MATEIQELDTQLMVAKKMYMSGKNYSNLVCKAWLKSINDETTSLKNNSTNSNKNSQSASVNNKKQEDFFSC